MRRIFSLLLIVALCSAMNMVVQTQDGTMVLSSPSMVTKVNTEQNILGISGILTVPMFPTIKSKGTQIAVSIPQVTEFSAGGSLPDFTVSYPENFAEDVFASVEIDIQDEYIGQLITVENSGESDLNVEIEVLPLESGKFYVFAPYKRDPNSNYLWISPELADERAEGIVVAFDTERPTFDQPQEINPKTNFVRVLAWNVPLAAGESRTIGIKYRPGYINEESLLEGNPYSASFSKQYILHTDSDALFTIEGEGSSAEIKPEIDETATGTDVLQAFKKTLDSVADTPTSESTLSTLNVDLNEAINKIETGLSSIEKSLLFREMSRMQGIPSEMLVGYKDGNYYAWTVSYLGTSKFTYDPVGKSGEYSLVYIEPETANCRDDLYACPWAGGIRTDLFCVGPICLSAYLLIGLFVLVLIVVFAVFQYKPDLIYRITGVKPGGQELIEDGLDGAYDIVNEKFIAKDPIEERVWDALRRRGGMFKSKDYASETGFSEVLLKSTIEELIEREIIKRRAGE